jgi:hypothetical protein
MLIIEVLHVEVEPEAGQEIGTGDGDDDQLEDFDQVLEEVIFVDLLLSGLVLAGIPVS